MIRNEPSSTLKLFCPAAGYLSQWAQVDPNLKVFRSSSIWECRHLSSKRVRKHIFPLSTNEYLVNKNVWISSTQHHTPAACWVLKSSVKKKIWEVLIWTLPPNAVRSCMIFDPCLCHAVVNQLPALYRQICISSCRQIYPIAQTNISSCTQI